nr:AAA family ATPase [Eubacteriales bacterium]
MKKICIYGKGGIGKSTVVANTAVAMSMKGLKVAVVGCDPKADSTRCIMGRRIPTVLDSVLLASGEEVCCRGFNDILCIESGGPQPGTGCAGRGIASALKEIRDRDLLSD